MLNKIKKTKNCKSHQYADKKEIPRGQNSVKTQAGKVNTKQTWLQVSQSRRARDKAPGHKRHGQPQKVKILKSFSLQGKLEIKLFLKKNSQSRTLHIGVTVDGMKRMELSFAIVFPGERTTKTNTFLENPHSLTARLKEFPLTNF